MSVPRRKAAPPKKNPRANNPRPRHRQYLPATAIRHIDAHEDTADLIALLHEYGDDSLSSSHLCIDITCYE